MENSSSLRSLVAGGRSSGTGRPTSSTARPAHRSEGARRADFDEHVARARRDDPRHAQRRDGPSERSSEAAQSSDPTERSAGEFPPFDSPSAQLDPPTRDGALTASSQTPDEATPSADPTQNGVEGEDDPAPKSTRAATPADAHVDAESAEDDPQSPAPTTQVAPETARLDPRSLGESGPQANPTQAQSGAASTLASNPQTQAQDVELAPLTAASPELAQTTESTTSSAPELEGVSSEAQGQRFELPAAHAAAHPAEGAPSLAPADAHTRSNDVVAALDKPPPTAPHSEPPLSADRAADVLRQVRLQLTPHMREAVIQLEPRELGRIAIKLSVSRGVVKAELRAEKRSTLDALERHAPELKTALERVGLSTNSLALELGFDGSSAQRSGADGRSHSSFKGAPSGDAPRSSSVSNAMSAIARRVVDASGVDTYA